MKISLRVGESITIEFIGNESTSYTIAYGDIVEVKKPKTLLPENATIDMDDVVPRKTSALARARFTDNLVYLERTANTNQIRGWHKCPCCSQKSSVRYHHCAVTWPDILWHSLFCNPKLFVPEWFENFINTTADGARAVASAHTAKKKKAND